MWVVEVENVGIDQLLRGRRRTCQTCRVAPTPTARFYTWISSCVCRRIAPSRKSHGECQMMLKRQRQRFSMIFYIFNNVGLLIYSGLAGLSYAASDAS